MEPLGTQSTPTVSAVDTSAGEQWTVRATPNDGYVDGTYTEAVIEISNTDPVLSSVTISSTTSFYNDSIVTCSATATDADDGVLVPTYEWTVGNTTHSGSTLDLSTTSAMPTDNIFCTATVVDSAGVMVSNTSSVLIENAESHY